MFHLEISDRDLPKKKTKQKLKGVSKLDPPSSILGFRISRLETRSSILENIEDRGSSFKSRLST